MNSFAFSPPEEPGSRRGRLAGIALFALFAAWYFRDVLGGGLFYLLDFHQTFEPLRTVYSDAVRRGSLLWSPRLGNGAPLLANPLYAALYPPNLLCAVFPTAAALTVLSVLHILWGSAGAWRLARLSGLGAPGAWTAAVVFGFSGASASATAYPNLSWTQAWLPWLLVSWQAATAPDLGARRRVASTLVLGLVAALLLTLGDPFILAAAAIALAVMAVSETARRFRRTRSGLVALWVPSGAAIVVALVLAFPLLAALCAYAPYSMRGIGFRPEGVQYWSLHPALVLDMLLPSPFGDLRLEGPGGFWGQAVAPEKGFPLFRGLYVGALTSALAILGALRRWRWRPATLTLACVFFLLALGRYGPLYPALSAMPLVRALRFPVKWMLPLLLPLALLAGSGVRAMQGGEGSGDLARRRALAVLLSVAGLLAFLTLSTSAGIDGWLVGLAGDGAVSGRLRAETLSRIRGDFALASGLAAIPVLLAAGALWLPSRRGGRWAAPVLAMLVTLDVGIANPRFAPTVPRSFYDEVPEAVRVLREEAEGLGRVWIEDPTVASARPLLRSERSVDRSWWQRRVVMGRVGAAYGLDLAFPLDTELLAPVDYTRLRVLLESAPAREKLMLLGAAGVTHAVAYRLADEPFLERVAVLPSQTSPPQIVWRNRLAVPRARLVPTLLPYEGDTGFIEAVGSRPEDLFQRVALVEIGELSAHGISPQSLAPPVWDGAPVSPGTAEILEDRGDVLRLRTRGKAAYLVLSDVLLPGWVASVDGVETPLLRADYAFRALPLAAGEHDVRMRYRVSRSWAGRRPQEPPG